MQRLIALLTISLVWLASMAAGYKVADIPNVQLADSTRFVSNPDGVLSAGAESRLNAMLQSLRARTTAEFVIVAVNDIDETDDIDRFATDLFNSWGVGQADKDNGVLLLLVRDRHEATIRTGQGSEGVLPDIIAGRIIRNDMIPHFRDDDYDGGIEAGAGRIASILTDPANADELRSDSPARFGRASAGEGHDRFFTFYLYFAVALAIAMLVVVGYSVGSTRKLDPVSRYRRLDRLSLITLFATFLGLGLPVVAWLWLRHSKRSLRDKPRECPHCHIPMQRLNEEEDNRYLTPAQDTEERINSIDYDVWLCPQCHDTEVIPYVNRSSAYTECPRCHARTYSMLTDQVVQQPTTLRDGYGVKTYTCRNCNYRNALRYTLPKVPVVVAPVGGRGGSGFGGGGFGGGGFGGGSSMGGGATGRW